MNQPSRRDFVVSAAALAAAVIGGQKTAPASPASTLPATRPFKTTLHKAMIIGTVDEATLAPLKHAGFQGVESRAIVPEAEAAKGREIADRMGMRVHSVLRGWAEFNSPDPAKVASSMAITVDALKAAAAYGADTVLTVPCRIGGMPMPNPWEFKIDFDDKTGHVQRVVEGDNAPYKDYIEAHNYAIDSSTQAVKKLIPTAEKAKIIIALENVWNNLWVQPEIFRHFVASFDSPWVKAYYDIGNHVKYGPPQEWVRVLGPLIVKCHVKDYRFTADRHNGGFVHPRNGAIDWPAVRAALDDIGYNGWLSIEDGGLSLKEFNRRIDLIIAGE